VWATLLDEGRYLASERTMYRLLAANGELRERRDQLAHPAYERPELLAERPNEVWSWDISKLKGPAKWTYYYLYAILDVFSRYCVGWTVQQRESAAVAKALIAQACEQQRVAPGRLTVHADRGSSMTSKPVALMLADLGVTKSHSRPHVSNDNPFSESQFKTMKYRPDFPERFGAIEDGRAPLRRLLRLVQHRAPPRRPRPPHAARRPPRPRRRPPAGARRGPRGCLRRPARAVSSRGAIGGRGAERGLDQQAAAGFTNSGGASVISAACCLIHVDRFRRDSCGASSSLARTSPLSADS
jgi:transposase InsO family protein